MNTAEFWDLIDQARKSVGKTTEIPAWIQAYLRNQPVEYIAAYALEFRKHSCLSYDARLWAAAGLMLKFCSDDKFTDFRAWLIAKGRDVFERTLQYPDALAEVEMDGDYNLPLLFYLNYTPQRAYREIAGESANITDLVPHFPKLILLNESFWDGDRSKLPVMFPKLYVKFDSVKNFSQ